MVRGSDLRHHSSVIHSINPSPRSPLDSLHSPNILHRHTIRAQVIKIIKP